MIVEIKQYADQSASSVGLDKYNRSKLPGTFELVQPSKGLDGRWVTGMDEDSVVVNSIQNQEVREKRRAEIKALRENLQSLTNFDLTATNDAFWQKYSIMLKDNFSLNFDYPQDRIKYYVLIANCYAAPELGAINSPEFVNTKYYISRKEEESRERVITRKTKDEAKAKLLELSKDYEKLVLIARYLLGSRRIKKGMDDSIIYEEVSMYIDDPKEKSNLSNFLDAVGRTVEELQYKLTVDEAVRMGIIKVREGYFQRGNATYGKSIKEAIDYLSGVQNSGEFNSLLDEVENSI